MIVTVKRDGFQWEQTLRTRHRDDEAARRSGRRAAPAPRSRSPPTRRSSRARTFTPAVIRERLEARAYLHRGLTLVFENEAAGHTETFQHERGIAEYLETVDRRERQATGRRAVLCRPPGRLHRRMRPRLDRVDRRAHPVLRQRHPDPVGRHARDRPEERPRQGGAQLSRGAEPHPEGADDRRRRHPRGPRRHPERLHPAAAVPGTDQGPPEQPRGHARRSTTSCAPALENYLLTQPHAGEGRSPNRVILAARARTASRAAAERCSARARCRTA